MDHTLLRKQTLKFIFPFLLIFLASSSSYGQSLLWEISGNGLASPSYLFGTMHSKQTEVIQKGTNILPYIDRCETFAMEIAMDESIYGDIFSMLVTDEDYQLRDHLTDEQYGKLEKWFKDNYGMKLGFFERIKPIFLYIMMEESGMGADKPFLDQYLAEEAKDRKKPILGLETIEEQMNALNILTLEEQVALLVEGIEKPGKGEKQQAKLRKLYLAEKLEKMYSMIEKTTDSDEFFKVLILDRNKNMAERIDAQLKKESTFTAVGAGHLPGDQGVIALLQAMGYNVVAVYQE